MWYPQELGETENGAVVVIRNLCAPIQSLCQRLSRDVAVRFFHRKRLPERSSHQRLSARLKTTLDLLGHLSQQRNGPRRRQNIKKRMEPPLLQLLRI